MNALYIRSSRLLLTSALLLGLAACNDPEPSEQALAPVAFHAGDECRVCGMAISGFPSPKGEAVEKGKVRKFCSTAELHGWWCRRKIVRCRPGSMFTTWAAAVGRNAMTTT